MRGKTLEVTSNGLLIDGQDQMLLSGEIHPWRLDPALWETILDRVVDLGFGFISTYVPWSVHEVYAGVFDFKGSRDIERFLRLASERGLKALVRIGPNAGAELQDSGWPRRILDDPRCQALRSNGLPYLLATATGHSFPPSYASPVVLREVAGWYDEVIARLSPLQHPDGPIVACQVDNEMSFHFQGHSFALDYHPDAIDQYRRFLSTRYAEIASLNNAYQSSFRSFDEVEPPADASDEPELRRVEWIEWREEHLRTTIATLAGMARERGMDRVPIFHNDYPRTTTPIDTGALGPAGAVDFAAGDIYSTKEGGRFVCDFARHLSGSTLLPFIVELGSGWLALPWLLPMEVTPQDEEVVAFEALLGGVRAFNFYMLVERDRWCGSPIASDGNLREPRASFIRELIQLLTELDWTSLRRHAPVLLLENRNESRRVAARETLGEIVPCFSQVMPMDLRLTQPDDEQARELRSWEKGLTDVLRRSGIDYDRASSSSMPDLDKYETVLIPTISSIDESVWDRLHAAAGSGTRVGAGPRVPALDEHLQHADFDPGPIAILADPEDAEALIPIPPFRTTDSSLDLHFFTGNGREVLAAANLGESAVESKIVFDGSARLQGRRRPEVLAGDGSVDVSLEPWEIKIWEVSR